MHVECVPSLARPRLAAGPAARAPMRWRCRRPRAAAAHEVASSELGLNPGENMAFEVRLAGVLAGEAQLAVGQIGDSRASARWWSVARRDRRRRRADQARRRRGDHRRSTSTPAARSRSRRIVEQGDKRTISLADVHRYGRRTSAIKSTDNAEPQRLKIDFGKIAGARRALGDGAAPRLERAAGHDAHGVRRRWPPAVAGRRHLRRRGDHRLGARQPARGAASTASRTARTATSRSRPTKPARTFEVWLSDDADRVPLKVTASTELGDIVMDLTEYNRNRTSPQWFRSVRARAQRGARARSSKRQFGADGNARSSAGGLAAPE